MQEPQTLACQSCQAANSYNQRNCFSCGESLAPARISRYLDLTEAEIVSGHYDTARSNLAKADVEMIGLPAELRKRYLLTARAFWLQSLIYYYKGQTDEAREELLLALTNLEGQPNSEQLMGNVLNNLGNVELYHDNPEAATQYYQRSIDVALACGNHDVAAKAMGNLGIIYSNEGRTDEALALTLRGLEQAELGGDPLRLGEMYRLLASSYASEGPYTTALSYAEKALAMRGQIADQACVCRISSEMGLIYLQCHDLDTAEACLNEAQALAQRTGYKLIQIANLNDLAELMLVRGNMEEMFNYASRALGIVGSATYQKTATTVLLVMYYADTQNWMQARKYLQWLEDTINPASSQTERVSLNRARVFFYAAQGNWEEADRYFNELSTLASTSQDTYQLATLTEEYANLLLRRLPIAKDDSAALRDRICAMLTEVATTYRRIELNVRLAEVEAKLQSLKHPSPSLPEANLSTGSLGAFSD